MKIVLATPLYPPEAGGPATYAQLLMDNFPTQGIDIAIVKFSDVRKYPRGIRHAIYFWNVVRASRNASLVLALDPVSVGLPALIAAKMCGKKFVVKIVGDFAWEQGTQKFGITDTLDQFVRKGRVPFPVAMMRAVQTYVAQGAEQIIVPSNYLKGVVTVWGVEASKIQVIYNSIEVPHSFIKREKVSGLVVSAGRLVPWKGFSALIEAVANVKKKNANVSLLIVGDGPDRQLLEAKGKELLGDYLTFAGSRSHEETLEAISSASVFVLNSTYEGLSHVLIEALMLGAPIIATDAGGNSELIEHEHNGLLIPVGDTVALEHALARVLEDVKFRSRISNAALNSSSKFSLEKMIERTKNLLQEVAT